MVLGRPRAGEQGLVDVAHPHSVVDELDQLIEGE